MHILISQRPLIRIELDIPESAEELTGNPDIEMDGTQCYETAGPQNGDIPTRDDNASEADVNASDDSIVCPQPASESPPSSRPRRTSCPPASYILDSDGNVSECSIKKRGYNKDDLSAVAAAKLRYGYGGRSLADTLTRNNKSHGYDQPVTHAKLRSAEFKLQMTKLRELKDFAPILLSWDGCEDTVKVKRGTVKRHHVTLVAHPGRRPLGFFEVGDKSADVHIKCLEAYFKLVGMKFDEILAVLTDGENGNSGGKGHPHGGSIGKLERHINRPVLRIICLLHTTEIFFKTFFEMLDGGTKGNKEFGGELGKAMSDDEALRTIGEFEEYGDYDLSLEGQEEHEISKDARTLFELAMSVREGYLDKALAGRKLIEMSTVRWTSTAQRALRLYMSNHHCAKSKNLKLLVRYIMDIYLPMHLNIKTRWRVENGPGLLVEQFMRWNQFCSDNAVSPKMKTKMAARMQGNCFMLHPHMLIASGVQLEGGFVEPDVNKRWHLPLVNLNATRVEDAIQTRIFDGVLHYKVEPLKELKNREWVAVSTPPGLHGDFTDMPCHSQGTEHAVALTSKVVADVNGTNQKGYLKQIGTILAVDCDRKSSRVGQ